MVGWSFVKLKEMMENSFRSEIGNFTYDWVNIAVNFEKAIKSENCHHTLEIGHYLSKTPIAFERFSCFSLVHFGFFHLIA